jgi:membrane protein implicated in regulation of membrane protease activity
MSLILWIALAAGGLLLFAAICILAAILLRRYRLRRRLRPPTKTLADVGRNLTEDLTKAIGNLDRDRSQLRARQDALAADEAAIRRIQETTISHLEGEVRRLKEALENKHE